jgi:uncharacterized protein (DUF2336 family)
MSGSALSDLSGLLALSRANELDLRPVILRVQTDLFVTAANRDRTTIAAFEALVSGLLPVVDDDTAAVVAKKLAPLAGTPERILELLVERGGEARRAVIESACALGETLIEAASRDGADLAEMRAARADVTASEIAELVARGDAGADLALARNEAVTLAGASLDTLVERARGNADLAKALLARADLPAAHRTPLYIEADEAQRAAIRAAVEPLAKIRSPSLPIRDREESDALVDLSMAGDRVGFADKLATMLRLDRDIEWDFACEERHDLLPFALLAAGLGEGDAIRVLLTLEPEVALSVKEVLRLVRLWRETPRATAAYLVEAILGTAARTQAGRYVPHMHTGGTAERPRTRDSTPERLTAPVSRELPKRA